MEAAPTGAAVARLGHCTSAGWAADGIGPNCTYVGRRQWHRSTLLVGSCARNVRSALEQHAQAWITSLLDTASAGNTDGVGALIFEDEQRSGDPDGTRAALRAWAVRDTRIRLMLAQPLLYPRWSRTQRLALCRNMIAYEAARLPDKGVYLALDLDCHTPPAPEVLAVVTQRLLAPASSWDVLTSNTRQPSLYYDRWALRSRTLTLDYDCWFNATERRARGSCTEYAITIDPTAALFAVESAFNGLGLYRAAAVRTALDAQCRYRGTKNSYLCEHVPFHVCMGQQRLRIGVLPSLLTSCGPTSVTARPVRVEMHANGSVQVHDHRPPVPPPKPKAPRQAKASSRRGSRGTRVAKTSAGSQTATPSSGSARRVRLR